MSVFTHAAADQADSDLERESIHRVRERMQDRVGRKIFGTFRMPGWTAFGFGHSIAAEIQRWHHRERIDLLEMEESFGWCADVASALPLPVVVKLHGPAFLGEDEPNSPFGKERIRREGMALRRASTITAPSKRTLAQTLSHYELTPARRAHIVNPITTVQETPLWRLQTCERNLILYVGRFDLRKGADVLLKAFKAVLRDRPDLKLLFVGPDSGIPTADGRRIYFREYLEGLYPPHLRDRVDFRGSVRIRDVMGMRAQAMATVVASRWENQSYALLEAMLQGCPVVCTDAGGCPENLVDGVTGFLARSGDPDAFAEKIARLLDDPVRAAAMGDASRRYVLQEHSVDTVAEKSLAMYEEILRAR